MPNLVFRIFPDENFLDMTLYQYGFEQCRPLHAYGPHMRNHYLFHYILSGEGVLYCEDKPGISTEYHVKPGCGFLIEPGVITTYRADRHNPWEYAWLEFDGLRAKGFMNQIGLSAKSPILTPTTPEGGEALKKEMLSIIRNTQAHPLELIGHLYLFLNCMLECSPNRKKTQGGHISEFYTREAVSYIEQNYDKNITVENMASLCNLDRSYFGKVFKENMGQSPQEFLIQYRMSRAAELLTGTDLSIAEIGQSVGYPNQLHFSRAFKSVHGIPPRTYRQKNKVISS